MIQDIQIRSGVIGGTLLSTALNISPHDLLFTAIMAVIGAVVSFFVSYILRKLFSDSDASKKKSKNA
ncbi:MAG: hypothetical protein ACYC0A_12205 [Lutibacter sp.]